jgi:large subunit ribosomal protein L9
LVRIVISSLDNKEFLDMQVVLHQDYTNLGKAMDVVTVTDGYARNFLIPQGIAVPATEGNKRAVAESKKVSDKREDKKLVAAKALAQKIESVPCTIPANVGEEDKLFGSVTAQDIAEFLGKEKIDVDKHDIELEEPIKQLGVYSVRIKLYKDVFATLKVWVVKEEAK